MNHPTYDSILDMILFNVSTFPELIAVKCGTTQITYRQLNDHADAIAGYLDQYDIPCNSIIAVAMERSAHLIAVCLGIMKHGSAYLPIDIDNPQHRNDSILNNAKIEYIFSDSVAFSTQRRSAKIVNPQVVFDQAYPRKRALLPTSSTCAYCIYTSGSTGEPKGVLISHSALLNHTQWFIEAFSVSELDVILQRTSVAFDASVWELWTGLAAGACTVMLPADQAKHPLGIIQTLLQENISIAQFVPTLLRELVRLRQFGHIPCRLVFCGGEPLTWSLVDLYFAKTRSQLVNLYGPTETTIEATFWRVDPLANRALPPPIGQAIRSMQVYLLDEHGAPVGREQQGEIVIAGPGVAIGYVNSPRENDLRFSSLIVDGEPVRIYKTGDIGLVSDSGELYFLGRRDSQVKVNGHRVELLDIEQIAQQTPGVQCATAYTDSLATGEKQICVAYVIQANSDSPVIEQKIRQAFAEQRPTYMHPSRLHKLTELPLLPNGKINHNQLRELNTRLDTAPTAINGDATAAEQLQEIWEEILGQRGISSHSHFFECGATSLSVMMLLGRISNLFNVDLTPQDIFDHPVLAQQSAFLDGATRQGDEHDVLLDACAWRRHAVEDTPGLAQWEILEKPLETPAYLENVVLAFNIQGECSAARVRDAFAAVLEEQPALRCSFNLKAQGHWRRTQHALDEFSLPFSLIKIAPEIDSRRAIAQRVAEASLSTFDLRRPPLIRALYIECPGADDALIITAHHIAFDGWSSAVLMDQLCSHYQSLLATGLPAKTINCLSYSTYTDAQHQRFSDNQLDKHVAFWQDALKSLPAPTPLLGAVQRPHQFTYRCAVIPLSLDARYPAIENLCVKTGFSLYVVLLTALLVALAKNTGSADLYVRSPVANRTDAAFEQVVGYFVHPMVIRPKCIEWTPSLPLLEQVNSSVLTAYGHALLPPHIFEAHCSPRSSAYGSRFPYWYNHHNYPSRQRLLGKSKLLSIGVPSSGIKTDVSLNTVRTETGLTGSLFYYRDAIPETCARTLLADFHNALDELVII